ncbi:MAG: glycosyltransferase [Pseudonocardiaceae bacterium]
MRVLILGPNHAGGSLPPYLDVLAAGLRGHGVTVDRRGSTEIPYDQAARRFWPIERMIAEARALADSVDLGAYDVVSLHCGNLEVDQLVPALWANNRPGPPVVSHVHTLAPTLFRDHVPNPHWRHVARQAFRTAHGYVYFGRFARDRLTRTIPGGRPDGVAWLPTTIPAGTVSRARPALAVALDVARGWPVISLYGYAAPWKDAALLRAALARMRTPARVVLAGDFWDDPAQAGIDLSGATTPMRLGVGEFVVVPGYLGPADRAALVRASAAGVFAYRPHPSFQGSGAIADYLAHAVPVVATDTANMAELVGDAGHVVPTGDPIALATALDMVAAADAPARNLAARATARAHRFTAQTHATRCLAVYQRVLDATAGRTA